MVDERRNPLEFEAVVRRFAESADVLANVREQLRVLGELRESEEATRQNLQDSSEQVSRFTVQAQAVLKGMEDVAVSEVFTDGR